MSRIRILPDDLVNQIAAGEVIERPSSVVKELLENALDAGARTIVIDIEGGGRRRIRVADDGEGLDRDDALLALERHATSKLRAAPDLGRIDTLGFRGEALPAIASVSRLTLTSSRDGRAGTQVEVEAGRVARVKDAGHPRGTTMDVRDLFFNTPARAKFLKSPQTELGHVSELVAAYAVTMPSIRVSLRHDGRKMIEVVAASAEKERIRQIFGSEWDEAISFEKSRGRYAARGLLLPPAASTSTRRTQHLYVNGRLVRDRLVGHGIIAACQAFLPKDRHAALCLFITCPPDAVDVNVHPAKAEVRFADPRAVHDLVQEAILEALRSAMPVTPLGAAMGVGMGAGMGTAMGADVTVDPAGGTRLSARPAVAGVREAALLVEPPTLLTAARGAAALAHYRESYIVAADHEGLLLIDQHAAHERILYERIANQELNPVGGERQKLLFPVTAPVPRRLVPRLSEVVEALEQLGIGVEPFGEATLKVTEAPSILDATILPGLIADLLEQMGEEESASVRELPGKRKLLATVACHAAIKVRMPLTFEKMNYLIEELFRTENPLKCPHGRPAVLRFSQVDIEKGFDRR